MKDDIFESRAKEKMERPKNRKRFNMLILKQEIGSGEFQKSGKTEYAPGRVWWRNDPHTAFMTLWNKDIT